jgi:putative membrane protein
MKKISIALWFLIAFIFFIACNGNDSTEKEGTTDANNTDVSTAEADNTRNNMQQDSLSQTSNIAAPDFVMKAASGSMMEVALGKMAQQKAKNQRVKNFGKLLVKDHTKANNELKGIASAKSITVPSEMMAEHKSHVDAMSKMSGTDFEKAYMSMMVNDHQKDISDYRNASENLTGAEIKNFASKTLPVLQKHLDSAQAINQNM